jgi:hypothetical protein
MKVFKGNLIDLVHISRHAKYGREGALGNSRLARTFLYQPAFMERGVKEQFASQKV